MRGTKYSYYSMRKRCLDNKHPYYSNYGGRGITICDRWLGENGFQNFLHDMGERPDGYTLERIDSNKRYCPENCRWATMHEQSRNRRSNICLTYNGRTMILSDWAKEIGVNRSTLYMRVKNPNHTVADILSPHKMKPGRK